MEVGLAPGHIVLDGDPAPLPKKGTETPNFRPMSIAAKRLYVSNQDTTWYGGRSQPGRHCVRWGPSSPLLRRHSPSIFGQCLLWPNGWMDEDATWYGSRSQPTPHCVGRGPSSPRERGTAAALLFSAHVYCGHGRPSHLLLSSCCMAHDRDRPTDGQTTLLTL